MSDKKKYPWSHSEKKDRRAAEGVYAGPEFFNKPEPPMCVYAGPEVMVTYAGPPVMNGAGAFAPPEVSDPAPETPKDASGTYCPCCGTPVSRESKFCHECGTVLNK